MQNERIESILSYITDKLFVNADDNRDSVINKLSDLESRIDDFFKNDILNDEDVAMINEFKEKISNSFNSRSLTNADVEFTN